MKEKKRRDKEARLIVFDLDGVIFEHDSFFEQMYDWYDKWAPKREILEICDKYLKKNTRKAADIIIGKMWKGLPDRGYWEIINGMKLNPGAKETFKALKKKGYKTMILSSSVLDAVKKAKMLLPGRIDYHICNIMEIKKRKITGKYRWNVVYNGKGKLLADFCRKKKISLRNVVTVGDNENDISMMEEAGLSIAFNSKSKKLKKVCKIVMNGNDMREILKYA